MKLPGKIWVCVVKDAIGGSFKIKEDIAHACPYVPEAEAERLRERVKQLEGALEKVAAHARRETNGLKEYEGDTYSLIFRLAREALGVEGESKA